MDNKFTTVEELYAVVIGVQLKDEGKVVSAKFNKIIGELGLDRVSVNDIKDIVEEIRNDEYLTELKNNAIEGKITLGDLRSVEDKKVFNGNDYHKVVSTYVTENEKVLSDLREIRRHNKEGAYLQMLIEGLKDSLVDELDGKSYIDKEIVDSSGEKELVVLLSDFHLGYVNRDLTHGGYSFSILKKRLNQFMQETVLTIQERNINNVTVYFVGDLVEHINMREVNQAFDTEFTLAEQISKGTKVLVDILGTLSEHIKGNLRFGMIGGNHDRLQGNKNHKVYNDNVSYIVLDTLFLLQETGALQGITLIDNREDVYTIRDNVAGKEIIVNHGDFLKGKGNHINKFIIDKAIDLLITGHVHHFSARQEDFARMHIVASSPMGYNNYAKELNLSKTKPSQQLVILDNNVEDIEIKTVFLD